MIQIFLREVNLIKYKFTPDYTRYKWMAQNIFFFVGHKRSLSLTKKAHLTSMLNPWIPFKYT
jgi:hypothetical protein